MLKSELKVKETLTWSMNTLRNWIVKEAAQTDNPASVFQIVENLNMISFVHSTEERHFCISDKGISKLNDLKSLDQEDLEVNGKHYIIAIHDTEHVILELIK